MVSVILDPKSKVEKVERTPMAATSGGGRLVVDALKKGDQAQNGMVADPDKIISAKIEVR